MIFLFCNELLQVIFCGSLRCIFIMTFYEHMYESIYTTLHSKECNDLIVFCSLERGSAVRLCKEKKNKVRQIGTRDRFAHSSACSFDGGLGKDFSITLQQHPLSRGIFRIFMLKITKDS